MIPFLKKNKDGKKPPKPTVPRTAQESIPFQRMFEDGTCRVRPGYYTRTIQYQDINYQLAQQEDKTAIFEEWCSFLNFFDSSIHFELSFVNTATDSADFEKSIRIPYQQDVLASPEVSNIFENSDFVYMLNQANGDRQILAKQLNISPHQLSYVTHSGEGEGLLFFGNVILPFVDHFPKDLELYRILTTKLNEISEGAQK